MKRGHLCDAGSYAMRTTVWREHLKDPEIDETRDRAEIYCLQRCCGMSDLNTKSRLANLQAQYDYTSNIFTMSGASSSHRLTADGIFISNIQNQCLPPPTPLIPCRGCPVHDLRWIWNPVPWNPALLSQFSKFSPCLWRCKCKSWWLFDVHASRSDSSRNGAVIDGSAFCLSARCTLMCRSRIQHSTNVWARVAYFVSIRLCSCLAIPPAPADSFADIFTENYAFTSYNEPPGKIEHVEAVSLPSTGFYCHVTRWYQPYCIDCIASTFR